MKQISSRENPLIKRIRALSNSTRDRKKLGQTVLDGDHLLSAALAAGRVPEAVVVSDQGLLRPAIAAVVERAETDCPVSVVPAALLDQISPVASTAGVLAIVPMPEASLPPDSGDAILLDQVQDAGNLGTLMRSATAAGIRHVLLTPGCAQAWSPKTLRAAMGAHFVCEIHESLDADAWLSAYEGEVFATCLGAGAADLFNADLKPRGVWLFGAEGAGLSPVLLARATRRLTIPMPGGIESLNVAAAAAVCLFEQVRQRLSR
ncbi:TrmH family RNA methyltransferase [Nitrogeniibacter aestuarii]|uniref:TrmH family RNA methyltransferase n=1 Tax=Nitrogeniibacter aestuarii TaxID=2815343 RepID=UPI001D0F6246|nr:RNA methyltransferase [Nitrogeniibacter aestuarii]